MVRPETVVGWHRQGFRHYWAWKSRRRRGRPAIRTELRDLIRRISRANPLGRAEDPWRAAEAGSGGISGDGFEVYAPAAEAAVAGVARVFEEPRQGSDRVGFLHSAHGDVSGPVRAGGAEPRPAPAGAFQCHRASDRGLDRSATGRGVRAGGDPTESDPGPRPGLWRAIFASGQDVRHPGSGHCSTLAVAKRLCRARDWIDSTGMPCPSRGDRRTASDGDPVEVRRLLQRDPDTLIVGQGRARATECAAAEPGQGDGGATRGWAPSRIPPESGVSRSDK